MDVQSHKRNNDVSLTRKPALRGKPAGRRALGNITNQNAEQQIGGKKKAGSNALKAGRAAKVARLQEQVSSSSSSTRTTRSSVAASSRGLRSSKTLAPPPASAAAAPAPATIKEDNRMEVEEDEGSVDDGVQMMDIDESPVQTTSSSAVAGAVGSLTGVAVSPEDVGDIDNELMEAEYIGDIVRGWTEREMILAPTVGYIDTVQRDINVLMREILIDWLVEVHLKFKLRTDVLYLTVQIIDRFLSLKSVHRTKLQLVGCTAMLLASKYEEIFAPTIADFVYMTTNAFDKPQFITMESLLLATLEFRLTRPSILNFVERYCKVSAADQKTTFMAEYLCEITLQKMHLTFERPSKVAAGALYLARTLIGLPPWTDVLTAHSCMVGADVVPCARIIYDILKETGCKYKAVRRKYSSKKFMEVARVNPGDLIF